MGGGVLEWWNVGVLGCWGDGGMGGWGCCTAHNKEAGARLAERNACLLDLEHALRSAKRALAFIIFEKKVV